jgi:hypothetical protein
MSHLWRARCVLLLSFTGSTVVLFSSKLLPAQSPPTTGTISGSVSDPSGARLPHALIHLQGPSLFRDITADGFGNFTIALPLGDYALSVAAPGFADFTTNISLSSTSTSVRLSVPLRIAVKDEAIAVPSDSFGDTSADDNASALVFKGTDLNAFSNDDATFQKEISALAPGVGGRGPSVFVNGFSGSGFPPKNTIASIRINRNPYSALYDALGFGRVEISTKPGGEKLHGELNVQATDKPFNGQNPYLTTQLPYYILNLDGNLSGSFNKKTAFFFNGVFNDQQNNAALNALAAATQLTPYSAAVRDPQLTTTFGLRLDRTLTPTNNLTARYEFNQLTQTNGGLTALLTTADQAYNSGTTSQTLQLIDTQTLGAHLLYESRFQYFRTRLTQDAVNATPTLLVQGAFNGGGNAAQSSRDNQDRFEFQQSLAVDRGKHFLRFGARYRLQRDANLSTANYNGQFTFPSLAAYIAKQPSQYSVTVGKSSANVLTGDLGVYAEDEWRVTKTVTLDLGFRLESQSAIPDHLDPAPRFGAAWAIHRKGKKPTFLTLRTGGGIFYGRFTPTDLLTTIRQNGISQQTFIATGNLNYPKPPTGADLAATPPTIYRLAPNLTSQYGWQGGFTIEKPIPKIGSVSLNYVATRGVHQFISRNINAPLPGTYNPAVPGSGTRPLGGTQNIYEFDSNGIEKNQVLFLNTRLTPVKGLTIFLVYDLARDNTNANGTNAFPTNSYNLSADYGRSSLERPVQSFFGGSYNLPLGVAFNLFGSFQSGLPWNITTGTDLNGDSIYNDRPAYATAPTASSVLYKTTFGTLDANPQPGEPIVPINRGRSPSFTYIDVNLSRDFKIGPRPASPAAVAGKPAPPRPDPPSAINFTVEASHRFNHRNPGPPVGVLTSPYFGQSLTLNNVFSPNTAANRVIYLQTSFHF